MEIWGWARREHIEKVQGRYTKMSMGLNINTPDYIWRAEAGAKGAGIYGRERASRYVLNILGMGDERWPKICLREELRGLGNQEPSRWGKEMKDAWEEAGSGEIIKMMREEQPLDEIRKKMDEALNILKNQEIQKGWEKIDKSEYWGRYKDIKESWGIEKYWGAREFSSKIKEQWARLRYGNISKEGKKGFLDMKCRVYKRQDETFSHIWQCQEARGRISKDVVKKLDEWRGEDKIRGSWANIIVNALKGVVVLEVCDYAREFEKLIRMEKMV